MKAMHSRCLSWATVGAALGASTAWAQDVPGVAATAGDPAAAILIELARISPLAAVLGALAFAVARMGPPTIRVVLVPEGPSMEDRIKELEAKLATRGDS